MLFNSICYAPTTPNHPFHLLSRYSRPGNLRFSPWDVTYSLRPAAYRYRLQLETHLPNTFAMPKYPPWSPPSRCDTISLHPLLRHSSPPRPATSLVANVYTLWSCGIDLANNLNNDKLNVMLFLIRGPCRHRSMRDNLTIRRPPVFANIAFMGERSLPRRHCVAASPTLPGHGPEPLTE